MLRGDAAQLRGVYRDTRGLPLLDSLLQDVRYALRSLAKVPGFTAAAVLLLAIGIGANTAIFNIVDEALLRPLDFPRPQELVDVFTFNKVSRMFLSTSYPDYEDLMARATAFQALSAFVRIPLNVSWKEHDQRLPVEAVTGNFFSMLALNPAQGRAFGEKDDSPAAEPVAMISEGIGDAGSIGKIITVEDQPFTIVGIVPKRYHGTNLNWGDPPQVWIPLQATLRITPRFRALGIFQQRPIRWLLVTGRLKAGVSVEQAQAEVRTIASETARDAPVDNRDISELVFEAGRAKFWPAYRTSITRSLTVFAAASGLVLLLTCANLSSLLLSRGLSRQREFAIRIAVGASRNRLVRQLLTESFLLVLPSCAAALAVAYGSGRVMVHFPNAFGLPLALEGGIESRALYFCMALSVVTTILFGLTPAFQTTRLDVLPALKESGNTGPGGGQDFLRNILLALQVAFSTILLVGAGLFGRSVMHAWSINPGFRLQGLLTVGFDASPSSTVSADRLKRSQADLVARLKELPGIAALTLASDRPMEPWHVSMQISTPEKKLTANEQTVGAEFFRTMGIELRSGREFSGRDSASGPSAIVNEKLAAQLWPGKNPVGETFTTHDSTLQVVGVVRDSQYRSVWEEAQSTFYTADVQSGHPANYLILRTKARPESFAPVVLTEWNRLMAHSPLYDFRSGDELLNVALAPQRVATGVFGAFGLMSVVLASVGLYSLMTYAVARRTHEIGIRLAIGGKPAVVMRQILGRSLVVAAAGIAAGAGISALLARFLTSQVNGVSVHDATTFMLVAALLGVVALLAAAIPARRAVRIDPQQALRSE